MNELTQQFFSELRQKFKDGALEEVLINGTRGVFAASSAGLQRTTPFSLGLDDISDVMRQIAWEKGLRLDVRSPACGGMIESLGIRWHAVISPVAQDEIIISFRKHHFRELSLESFSFLSPSHLQLIGEGIEAQLPILIAGSTGVGKTTFLLSLLKKWHLSRRVILIETISELPPLSDSWLRLTEASMQVSGDGAFSLEQIARETLRLRPEVFVVGELRGAEANVFLDLSLCGQGGCLATIHAGSTDGAMVRLKQMADKTAKSLPANWQAVVILLGRNNGIVTVQDVKRLGLH